MIADALKLLSRQQLQQLATEATALADWTTMRDFANQMYGEGKAVKVETETYGSDNDEGGTDYRIESITAYDADGKELNFDYNLPFFATKGWKESADDDEDNKDHYEDISRLRSTCMTDDDEERGPWILIEDLPVDEHNGDGQVIDLTAPPTLTTLPI